MTDFGLYVIATRPTLSYAKVAEICVKRGVRYLQLREKDIDDRVLLSAAREIREVTQGTQTKFVINDRADIAVLSDADVLHLGQGDLSMADARKIVGDMPIGLSTHSIEQALAAIEQKPIYIGFGPVYPTTTKKNPDPTVGIELLRQVVGLSSVPVVAIGGIFPENIGEVIAAGAKNICMVRHLMCDENLEEKIFRLQKIL